MSKQLTVAIGQYSDKGRKNTNQDFYGIYIPEEPLLSSKGICIALADGISTSDVSQIASETAVSTFFADYYCTSDAWSVKTSAQQVLIAANSWLFSQTQRSPYRYEKDKGFVCTFSALVIKATTAHIFHAGDTRIYRLQGAVLEQLTNDHRLWISAEKSYLSRALGVNSQLDIDYRAVPVEKGDVFILVTDGVYEYADNQTIIGHISQHRDQLDAAAEAIVTTAYNKGSPDNLTVQIVRIENLPPDSPLGNYQELTELPFPPALEPRMLFDGFKIIRQIHASSRSHVYLALDPATQNQVVLKTPSVDLRDNADYLARFLLEEWIARRINNAHVLKPCAQTRKRNFIYTVTEFIDGQTLTQWLRDHPNPDVETVRGIVEQIAKGLRAFHRQEMLHQDLRPENIMIDGTGTVKIIDFGSTRVAGIAESAKRGDNAILGTAQYTAPEYFLGEAGTTRSDLFSLGVIAYQMLSGRLPYGAQVAKSRTKAAQQKLVYTSVLDDEREIPAWIDEAIKKAVHPNPLKRHDELSEFIYDLRHPSQTFLNKTRPPLMARNPLAFWQGISLVLAIVVAILLFRIAGQ